MESEITYFLGRFHPLVVHLPIGFLIFGLLLESISLTLQKNSNTWKQAIGWSYLGGGITGLIAVATGWMLAEEGQHSDSALNWHRWMGVSVCVFAFIVWMLRTEKIKASLRTYYANLVILVIALLITGHLGGNLTHGSEYLIKYAPRSIRALFGSKGEEQMLSIPSNPDSVLLFEHLIKPILSAKCVSCHNGDKVKGGLDLTSKETILKGGDELTAIVSGKPIQSGIFQRVTLPSGDPDFMPPKGQPLDYNEIKIIEWWILNGASFTDKLSDYRISPDISWVLMENYGLDTRPKPFFEIIPIDPLPRSTIDEIKESGFSGGVLAESNNYLKLNATRKDYGEKDWQNLLGAKEYVVVLDLAGTEVTDKDMEWIGQLHNLYSLDLNNTRITDVGVASLKDMDRLEILNLYGTTVGDSGMDVLKSLPSLKRIYMWGTRVTEGFIENWESENENIEVVFESEASAKRK